MTSATSQGNDAFGVDIDELLNVGDAEINRAGGPR